jgi:hypothetical protein
MSEALMNIGRVMDIMDGGPLYGQQFASNFDREAWLDRHPQAQQGQKNIVYEAPTQTDAPIYETSIVDGLAATVQTGIKQQGGYGGNLCIQRMAPDGTLWTTAMKCVLEAKFDPETQLKTSSILSIQSPTPIDPVEACGYLDARNQSEGKEFDPLACENALQPLSVHTSPSPLYYSEFDVMPGGEVILGPSEEIGQTLVSVDALTTAVASQASLDPSYNHPVNSHRITDICPDGLILVPLALAVVGDRVVKKIKSMRSRQK